ncbi:MAG: ABC transporter substrate-binding protein [Acidimicrobiales bacterium]
MPSVRSAGRRRRRLACVVPVASALALVLGACGNNAASTSHHKILKGGTASYSLGVGSLFNWMLPLANETGYQVWDAAIEDEMWRPLYFAGDGAKPVIDYAYSAAYRPVWSEGDRTVTIRLKPMHWSDGKPVTTRDVRFFFDLYDADKTSIADYIPGDLPDNVASVDYPSKSTFVMHLKGPFSQQWYDDNELTKIVPIPQHVWDRESPGGPVGNYDLTHDGAVKVFDFLTAQSKQLSTYATNPLWKVVDGPWVIDTYDPTTAETKLSVNKSYPGPDKPRLDHVVIETFTSDTAEVDALRSGQIDYGWLPYSDYALTSYFASHGFTVAPWPAEFVQWAELGYTSKTYGPLVRQLYIRQALQHLVDEPLYLKTTLHGDGQLTYGPVPNLPGSPYVSPQERKDPYPYSIPDAKSLLTSHGWQPGPGKVMVCERPGTAADECGAGIKKGRPLDILLMYMTGSPTLQAQVGALQTAAASAGITLSLDPQSQTTMFSIAGTCPPGPCNWGLAWYSYYLWPFGGGQVYPTGAQMFGKGNYWGGGYYSPEAQHLIELSHTHTGIEYLYDYENYISRQVAALWLPTWDNSISVVSDHLGGWQPQQVFADPLPQRWYLTR